MCIDGLNRHDFFIMLPTFMDGHSVLKLMDEITIILQKEYQLVKITFIVIDDSLGYDTCLSHLIDGREILRDDGSSVVLLTPAYKGGNQSSILWALHSLSWPSSDKAFLIVMDADGEDSPHDLPRMMRKLSEENLDLVYAKRGKRFSPFSFRAGKLAFSILFRILTGKFLETGNFSVMRVLWLKKCLDMGNFTSSFAGELSYLPSRKTTILCDRAPRLRGASKTNFSALVTFGMRQLIPWCEIIAVRTFFWFSVASVMTGGITGLILLLKYHYGLATPAWSTLVVGLSSIVTLISLMLFILSISILIQTDSAKRVIRLIEARNNPKS